MRRTSIRRLLAGMFALLSVSAQAQITPLIFEREALRIESPGAPPTQETAEAEEPVSRPLQASAWHPPLEIDTEIRREDALRLEYIHTLNALADNSGVMIVFSAPSMVTLPAMKVPTAVDVLFVEDSGRVLQILPNIVLADLAQEVLPKAPIKAFFFLKSGLVKQKNIRPQDVVVGKPFNPAPPMMQ